MTYKVRTIYDDGFKSVKEFGELGEAKSFFLNVDVQDIESCFLCELAEGTWTEVARKEPRKKKPEKEAEKEE
ncbi:MAG: hypothetical protein FWH44_05230 [Methanomassiliicoccaceae archaeon]|nr:hypothetical protein [Methanomassiliicoccaceae archaeon]